MHLRCWGVHPLLAGLSTDQAMCMCPCCWPVLSYRLTSLCTAWLQQHCSGTPAQHLIGKACPTPPCSRYYGMASISHTGLISSMFRDGWPQRLNLSACELFATLYKDYVHPSDTGRLLLVGGWLTSCPAGIPT